MAATGTYLYAITKPSVRPDLTSVRGVADEPLRIVEDEDLACVVGSVPLDEFGEEALVRNLESLAWLERVARRHDAVVRAVAEQNAAVPLRLAVICSDDGSAQARVRTLGTRAVELLDRIEGREEWGVKLFAAVGRGEPGAGTDPPASGTAYLQRRRQALAEREGAATEARRDADVVYERLAGSAVAARRHRLQDQRLTGSALPMVLNAAFLVERAQRDAFRTVVDELADGREPDTFVLTGPWPPYSFAALEEE